MLLGFVSDAENELEMSERAAASAHAELVKWNGKDYAGNNPERGSMRYPLPASPIDDILEVIRGDRAKQALGRP